MSTIRRTVRGLRGDGRGWTLLVVSAGWLFVNGFRVVLPALLPDITAEFTLSNTGAGFALTVLWASYAGLQFPAGVLAGRLGERRLLIVGTLLGALSFGAFYLAPGYTLFLLACALFGVGAGLFGTPRDMLLSRTYPDADSTAYAVTFAAGSLGGAALPYAATAVAGQFGWRAAVVWLLPLLLAVAAGLRRVLPPTPPKDGNGAAPLATARATFGALTDRSVVLAAGALVLAVFSYQALLSFLPTYLIDVKDLEPGLAAGLYGLVFVLGAVVMPLSGHLADQYSERATVLGVIALATLTLGALPLVDGRMALAVLVPLLGVRIAVGPLASAFVVRELPPAVQGAGWGLLRATFFGIGATGSTALGAFADAGLFDTGLLALAGLTAAAGGLWLLIPSER